MAQQPSEVKTPVAMPKVEMDAVVLNDFRRILGLAPGGEIPDALKQLYLRYAKRVDICSAGRITVKELILLTLLLPSDAPAFVLPFPIGSSVSVLFSGKTVVGEVVGGDAAFAKIHLPGDTENLRRFRWFDVKPV